MVVSREAAREQIVRTPPSLFFSIGVPVCWVIDPVRRRGWTAAPRVLTEVADAILRVGEIEMPLHAVLEPLRSRPSMGTRMAGAILTGR
jgi:hypothetical protein